MSKSKIVFILTGSIAAFKAAAVISRLVQDGHEVRTVATKSALRFIGAATLEGLTGQSVLTDLWQEGRAMEHIHLGRWADFAVICPASANTLARLSQGLSDDLVGALMLAWPREKRVHVFPAMNTRMFDHPATQSHLSRLREWGYRVHLPAAGNLACGETGSGRLLEPDEILAALTTPARGEVLITAGATREPIDGIRFISNVSTGRTGAELADLLAASGWRVTYVHGPGAMLPSRAHARLAFTDFQNLDEQLRSLLRTTAFRAVIHAAAVSDYSVDRVGEESPDSTVKLKTAGELNLRLRANHKILPRLKEYAVDKSMRVIGFKLTLNQSAPDTAEVARELLGPTVDAVVANDWSRVAADRERHPGQLLTATDKVDFEDLSHLARVLHDYLSEGDEHGSLS